MSLLHQMVVWIHVALGFVGLAAFWVPVFSRKGGPNHVRFGKIYAWCATIVTVSAMVASVLRYFHYRGEGMAVAEHPAQYGFVLFLFYLSIVTLSSVRHGVRVIQTKKDAATIQTGFHTGLAYVSIAGSVAVIAYALVYWSGSSVVLLALSPVGILNGAAILTYVRKAAGSKREWFYAHMGAMLGGGIAFHTAFAVFGASRLFEYSLTGPWAVVPWIAPAAIGVPANAIWERYYRKKFKDPK